MVAKISFKRVILYARQQRANQDVVETLQQITAYLKQRNLAIYLDQDTAECCDLDVPVLPRKDMTSEHDLIVVVGGDGSLLSAAQIAILHHVPVIGINRGRLGFLTDISPQEFALQLDQVLEGHYTTESRSLLSLSIQDTSGLQFKAVALNDVVLSRGNETRLIAFDVYIDTQFVSHYRADGLIIATPTGSTAYALSAGGPILHPQLNAMVMVPMFSHSLSTRPLVINNESKVALQISDDNDMPLQISCDGHQPFTINPGQRALICKHDAPLQLLHPTDYHYYDTLRIKLGWGSKG